MTLREYAKSLGIDDIDALNVKVRVAFATFYGDCLSRPEVKKKEAVEATRRKKAGQ